jgi:hypothetical protein
MSKEHFIPDKRIRLLSEENPEGISASKIESKTKND